MSHGVPALHVMQVRTTEFPLPRLFSVVSLMFSRAPQ
jgi:hypothetical protein